MIVFYTGTGNSRYVAQGIAKHIGDSLHDAAGDMRNSAFPELNSDRPWVFVSPTYAWRLPKIMGDWMGKSRFTGSKKAYFVLTCGSEIGNAEKYLREDCEKLGLEFCGVQEVVMPENYVAMFGVPDEVKSEQIRKAAEPAIESAARAVQEGKEIPSKKVNFADRIKSGPVNKKFYKYAVKSDAFTVSDKCTGCGRCEKGCPVHGIEMKNGKPVWTGACTHCMACISYCPTEAIEYGNKSEGKPRYKCPDYV